MSDRMPAPVTHRVQTPNPQATAHHAAVQQLINRPQHQTDDAQADARNRASEAARHAPQGPKNANASRGQRGS